MIAIPPDCVNFHYITTQIIIMTVMVIFTQVVWLGRDSTSATWEPESSLPQQLVREYEEGIIREVHDISHASCGQTVHTLASKNLGNERPHKQPRVENSQCTSVPAGYVGYNK